MQRRLKADESAPGDGPASSPPPRVLLTGFGPFPGIAENASAMLVRALAGRLPHVYPAMALETVILPTEWRTAPDQVQTALKEFRPDIAVHFGVASETSAFRLETLAQNARNRLADAAGHVHRRRRISAGAPDILLATFPAEAIRQRLERLGLPVEVSCDAGQYVCNATLFRSLSLSARARGAPMAGFVHIPSALCDAEQARSLQGLDWSRARPIVGCV